MTCIKTVAVALRLPKDEHQQKPIAIARVPEAAALDLEETAPAIVIVAIVAGVAVEEEEEEQEEVDREVTSVAGGDRGAGLAPMTGGEVKVLGRGRIAVVGAMIVA